MRLVWECLIIKIILLLVAFNVSHIVNTLNPLKCKLYLKFNLGSNMILVITSCM